MDDVCLGLGIKKNKFWSYDATTEALAGPTISIDHFFDLVQHFFTKTRWRRTFKLVRGFSG